MTRECNNFSEVLEDDSYERGIDQEPEPEREVKQGKRIFTIAMRKVNNKYTQEVVGVRMA